MARATMTPECRSCIRRRNYEIPIILLMAGLFAGPAAAQSLEDLQLLSIEDLSSVEVTSVSKRPEPVSHAAASIYVITNEDVRRAGSSSLPEALRLAPNLQVARLDSANYGISARGFNHSTGTANKLEVLIDGRTVYTPLYSGVFWDAQDVVLADLDRVEVISGPGGALWGANAVNGVINVITRSARETQGFYAGLSGGSLDGNATLRYGGMVNDDAAYRVYLSADHRGEMRTLTGGDSRDSWEKLQGGFRSDWAIGASDTLTVQGDLYSALTERQVVNAPRASIEGGNVLGRWSRVFDDQSALSLQIYYDRTGRDTTSDITATVDTYDVEAQYSFAAGSRQNFTLGGGYRLTEDELRPGPGTVFLLPARKTLRLANIFVQDQIALADDLTLKLGFKAEDNSYTGTEYMPDARLAWQVSDSDLLWTAISRAVRRPARFDRDLINPGLLSGGPNFVSEDLLAYEAGYRAQMSNRASVSISLFYNFYDRLRTVEATTPFVFPLQVRNGMEGETYGVELWGNYAPLPWWRLSLGVNTLHKKLHLDAGSRDIFGVAFAGNDPAYQASIRSSMDLPGNLELDIGFRTVGELKSPAIDSYVEADARLGWRMTQTVNVALTGNNLLHERHTEFINGSIPVRQIPRSVTASVNWRF